MSRLRTGLEKHCNFLVGEIPTGSRLGVYSSCLMLNETEGKIKVYKNIFCKKKKKNVCLKTTRKSSKLLRGIISE